MRPTERENAVARTCAPAPCHAGRHCLATCRHGAGSHVRASAFSRSGVLPLPALSHLATHAATAANGGTDGECPDVADGYDSIPKPSSSPVRFLKAKIKSNRMAYSPIAARWLRAPSVKAGSTNHSHSGPGSRTTRYARHSSTEQTRRRHHLRSYIS